jgi:hypothetical protein
MEISQPIQLQNSWANIYRFGGQKAVAGKQHPGRIDTNPGT